MSGKIFDMEDGKFKEYSDVPVLGETIWDGRLYYKITKAGSDEYFASVTKSDDNVRRITIPDYIYYKGYEITIDSIAAKAFYGRTDLASIETYGAMNIGNRAFTGCTGLESISIDGSVGDCAFYNCTGLRDVFINAPEIGYKAFCGCTGLNSIEFGSVDSIDSTAFAGIRFYSMNGERLSVTPENVSEKRFLSKDGALWEYSEGLALNEEFEDSGVIYRITNIGENGSYEAAVAGVTPYAIALDIPESFSYDIYEISVTSIDAKALYGNTDVEEVSAPYVEKIGSKAFANCSSITTIHIGGDVGSYAFFRCTAVSTAQFEKITSVGDNAFYGMRFANADGTSLSATCGSLSNNEFIDVGNGKLTIVTGYPVVGEQVSIDNYILELTSINGDGSYTASMVGFYICPMNLTIADTELEYSGYTVYLTSIAPKTFYGYGDIGYVDIGAIEEIGDRAFANCSGITYAAVGGDIGTCAFYGCDSLESLTIGDGSSLGTKSFCGCSGLWKVVFGESVEIGENAFVGQNFYDEKGNLLSQTGNDLAGKTFVGSNGTLRIQNGGIVIGGTFAYEGLTYLATKQNDDGVFEATLVESSPDVIDIAVPETIDYGTSTAKVTAIANKLFYNNTDIISVDAHDVQDIGYKAFANCSGIKSLKISGAIGDYAFYRCTGVEYIEFGELSSIGTNALYGMKFYTADGTRLSETPDVLSGLSFQKVNGKLTVVTETPSVGEVFEFDGITCEITLSDPDNEIYEAAIIGTTSDFKLENLMIPNVLFKNVNVSITEIGDRAFYGCETITYLYALDVDRIGNRAFSGCVNLRTAYVGGDIDECAFYHCYGIEILGIRSESSLGYKSFCGDSGVIEVDFGESLVIDETALVGMRFYAPDKTQLSATSENLSGQRFVMEDGKLVQYVSMPVVGEKFMYNLLNFEVTEVDEDSRTAFATLTGSKEAYEVLNLSDMNITYKDHMITVNEISPRAFYDCDALTYFDAGDVSTIGNRAFTGCDNLKTVIVKGDIGDYAFYECGSLSDVTIGDASLGTKSFCRCSGVQTIGFGTISEIGDYAIFGMKFYDQDGNRLAADASTLSNKYFENDGTAFVIADQPLDN